jgi:hypothetical protein
MSMKSTLVDYLADVVLAEPTLADIRVVGSVRELGELGKTPVMVVKTNGFEKLPAAPHKRVGHFTATLVSPHRDIDRGEDDLDTRLEVLLPLLLTAGLNWTDATQTVWGKDADGNPAHLCYDIALDSILTPEV